MFKLSIEDMKNLGLNKGQIIKLKKYIEYAKKETNVLISKNSTKEEVASFLKKDLKFSDNTIQELDLDGESLFLFEEEEIDDSEDFKMLTKEEKKNFKIFLKKNNKIKNSQIEIRDKNEISLKDIENNNINMKTNNLKYANDNENNQILFEIKNSKIQNNLIGKANNNMKYNKIIEEEHKNESESNKKYLPNKLSNLFQNINHQKDKEIIKNVSNDNMIINHKEKLEHLNINKFNNNNEMKEKEQKDNSNKIIIQEQENKNKNDIIVENKEQKNKEIGNKINKEQENKNKNDIIHENNKIIKEQKNKEIENKIIKEQENKNKNDIIVENNKLIIEQNNKEIENKIIKEQEYKNKNDIIVENNKIIKEQKNKEIENKKGDDKRNKKLINQNNIKKIEKKKDLKEYKGQKSNNIIYTSLNINKIHPIINDSKYNLFFILGIQEKKINSTNLSIYTEHKNSIFFGTYYYIYNYYFLEQQIISKNKEKISYIIIQIPLIKDIGKLSFDVLVDENQFKRQIDDIKGLHNYFLIYNLNNDCQILQEFTDNEIIYFYLNYFFNGEKNQEQNLQKAFIEALINKIDKIDKIKLNADNILKFFKYCNYFELQPKNIKVINLITKDKDNKDSIIKLDKNFYFSNEEIMNFKIDGKEKSEFINLIVKIYSIYDKEFLLELIQSKNWEIYSRFFIQLINTKQLKFSDLLLNNLDSLSICQQNLLSLAITKQDIDDVLKISINFVNCLKFIKNNYGTIMNILNKNNKNNYDNLYLSIPKIKKDDDIEEIYKLLSDIIDYKIINFEKIFDDLISLYKNESLSDFFKIKKLVILLEKRINKKKIIDFYDNINAKGKRLIKEKKMNLNEIIEFVKKQDIYYYDEKYINDKHRDPEIFKYISIKDNIQILRNNKIWEIFHKSSKNIQIQFYQLFLEEVKEMKDYKYIFDLFPMENINKIFTELIVEKFKIIKENDKYKFLDEKEENFNTLFEIFQNILICENKYNITLTTPVQINYHFTSKFYLFLLNNEKVKYFIHKIKKEIIEFFLEQNRSGNKNEESIISLLLCSPFSLDLLNEMEPEILEENDFYDTEENKKYNLFKCFFEKCVNLIKDKNLSKGIYLSRSVQLKNKIYKDLNEKNLKFSLIINLFDENNENNLFFNKILVIVDGNENKSKDIYNKIKLDLKQCKKKLEIFESIKKYYHSFFKNEKKTLINKIENELNNLKEKNINEIIGLKENEIIIDDTFNFETSIKESENIKYYYSKFFRSIYDKKYENNENNINEEKKILDESIIDFKETIGKIIKQKETKEPFYKINNIKEILEVIENCKDDFNEEIEFINKEFSNLDNNNYIINGLLDDLIIYSYKDKVEKLIDSLIYFIESFIKIFIIQETEFLRKFKNIQNKLKLETVTTEEIKEALLILDEYNYDINNKTPLIKFYELFFDKKDSITFIKKIKDDNLEIRNLNEFIDENENSQLQTTDIDNLLEVYAFFNNLIENKEIQTDEIFHKFFRKSFESNKDIIIKLYGYLNVYGEIKLIYEKYNENPEMAIQIVHKLIQKSKIEIFKEEKDDIFIFKMKYFNQKDEEVEMTIDKIEQLKNKILISSTSSNYLKEEGKEDKITKEKLTNIFLTLIDNIEQLIKTLNSLLYSGYPNIIYLKLEVEDSITYEENNKNKKLEELIEDYKKENKEYKKIIKKGYEAFILIREFHGKQFIRIYEKLKNNNIDISYLLNPISFNKVQNYNVNYEYNNHINNIENINNYLEKLFKLNGVNIKEIYKKNEVKKELNIVPGLYRYVKFNKDYSNLTNNILNLYIRLTENSPIYNTLLICNEETDIEKIKAFLYRAILCDEPILFTITNIEYLELSFTQSIIVTLKKLYKFKNKKINSYLLFIYEKDDSGFSRDIEKIIPEKSILSDDFLKPINNDNKELFKEIKLYSSEFSGYGKTTEIINEIKEANGEYYYLPIGGSFSRNYVINNLKNLQLDLKKGNKVYLHIDLSETDNDNLMNEILFKLLILKTIDSKEIIFYIGNNINIIIEIPQGFTNFEEKFKILQLFKKEYIKELKPLRLEEKIKKNKIKYSPISIVAEILKLYENGEIRTKNIDLKSEIKLTAKQCEEIINRHFKPEKQNYYQKMNFIKILSVQFKKFTKCIYYQYDQSDPNAQTIGNARMLAIKNFIELTQVFTCSPYNDIIFKKYDKKKKKEDIFKELSEKKNNVFSFEDIKPSLVFFNKDGQSLSIITNTERKDQEYRELQALWNSQNFQSKVEELKNYKKMSHEQLINEIKILFSLDSMTYNEKNGNEDETEKKRKEMIKNFWEKLNNYIFVSDNFIKMVRLLLNIEAKIPIILMGETGVGKTKLLEILSLLYSKGERKWKKKKIHAGITDEEIVSFIEEITKEVKKDEKETTWVFLDEINTCNSLGLITEIICNHTYLGKRINDNIIFIAACNPYRCLTKKMKQSGLVYYNMNEKNKLDNLVYMVNPLPHSLLNFVIDFGSLKDEDEEKYIQNTIFEIIKNFEKEQLIKYNDEEELNDIKDKITETIILCHKFLKEKYDNSSVSLREIRRFGLFLEYFVKYFEKDNCYEKINNSLNMSLYLCYYLRLSEKEYRDELSKKLTYYFKSGFLTKPNKEVKKITKEMNIEKNKGIALSRVLRENLFTTFICIINEVPLIIIGKPGTSKSLSFQILFDTMKGKYSKSEIFKDKGKLYRYYYQGSETSTSEGIKNIFSKAISQRKKEKDNKINYHLVFFDEMGLAERSINNPLKILHFLLEKKRKEKRVPFLGISNWKLDASKINRTICLSITDYDIKDLKEISFSISESLAPKLSKDYKDFFIILSKTYKKYIEDQNTNKENKDFHGNRDFYNLIKNATLLLNEKKKELLKKKNKCLIEIGIESLERNFGGLENSKQIIKGIFMEQYGYKFKKEYNLEKEKPILEIIEKNIDDSNSRYLMLISDGKDGSDIIKGLLNSKKRNYIELVGSKYKKDIKSGRYSEEMLNKIKYIMETDNVLILRELDIIYPSLYDLFNQNFTRMGDKKFARIAFEYAKLSSEVNNNFHVIIIVNKNKIEKLKLDPPFLNRFEKHIINYRMMLDENDINISRKIDDYLKLISSLNNNKELKFDLERLFINREIHNIEGLIFKIKKERKINYKDPKYEIILITEIFKKYTPTFCQDIIVSLLYSNIDRKYSQINDIIIEIYKSSRFHNFKTFLEKAQSQKIILYTFSKITENLFNEGEKIENKIFGIFSKQSTTELIESIKSENELIHILKNFFSSNNKKLLVLRFSENNLNKISTVQYIINNFDKENQNKIIILMIHRQRQLKSNTKRRINTDLISFNNDDYYQLFIDNLHGKENLDIFTIISSQTEFLGKIFLNETNFLENKIYIILSYLKFKILDEADAKNCASILAKKIIENKNISELLRKNLEIQSKSSKSINYIINEVFTSDTFEVNNVDFFEVISTKLNDYFSLYLLNIIYDSLKELILIPILNDDTFNIIIQNEFFYSLINDEFKKTNFKFPPLKLSIYSNNISIYYGFKLPNSKQYLEKIIKYVEKKKSEYFQNEDKLRNKNYNKAKKHIENYENKLKQIKEDIKLEINKYKYLEVIYSKNEVEIAKLLLNDYIKYFIIKDLNKNKNIEKIFNFLILIIKIKLSQENNHIYDFEYTIEEFIQIILFTQGYKEDIIIFVKTFINIQEYNLDLENQMNMILEENIIKYEISERNKDYTKIVNSGIYNIIESMLRSLLLFSSELIKQDIEQFYKYSCSFPSLLADFEKINKKYYLFSKEIYNLSLIIKIQEYHKCNMELFEKYYEKLMDALMSQSIHLYNNDYKNLFKITEKLNELFNKTFTVKTDDYTKLLFFIFSQQYKIICNNEERIKLIEMILKEPSLIKKSKIFLSDILKNMKPELLLENNKNNDKKEMLIKNFLNLVGNKKYERFKSLFNLIDNLDSKELNEILLFIFENQCQSYFTSILENYNNIYTKEACEQLILHLSFKYLKKAVQFICDHNNNKMNIALKLYAIAYIKTYFYFFVEIHYEHKDKCNFQNIFNLFDDINENKRKMIYIYILRLYCTKFDNFDIFQKYFEENEFQFYEEFKKELEENNSKYIFRESFITKNHFDINTTKVINKILSGNQKTIENDLNEINNNFDYFYCGLVNKNLSFLYSNDKNEYIKILKQIYELTKDKINLGIEGKKLFQYLMDYELFENKIIKTLLKKKSLTQQEFEILLYSFRFILNIQTNKKKCFYNDLLKENMHNFVENNYIPGTFPYISEYIKSYYILEEEFKVIQKLGYYICSECGFLYKVNPCTYPNQENEKDEKDYIYCINGHKIGGKGGKLVKKDIRVYPNTDELKKYPPNYNDFEQKTLEQFKNDFVIKDLLKREKGLKSNYLYNGFTSKKPVRNLDNITFRILNFILYSYLFCGYILNYLNEQEMKDYIGDDNIFNSLLSIIKKNWEILNNSLKEIGFKNIQIFINMIFNKIIEKINNLESVDTIEKFDQFEKSINDFILEIKSDKNNIDNLNNEYHKLNDELLSLNPLSFKEIIQSNYEPIIYPQNEFPDIQYYSISNIYNLNTFIQKFNSSDTNIANYALTNVLINKYTEGNNVKELLTNATNMQNLININKLSNLLLNIYSYKISREDGEIIFNKEIKNIINNYNEMNEIQIKDEGDFIEKFVKPFIKSWDNIKEHTKYINCIQLIDEKKGEKPFEMSIDKELSYFLVDKGEIGGGIFLASAYEYFIKSQNDFIEQIMFNNRTSGILYGYYPQLNQTICIQDANNDEIININEKTDKVLKELISFSSMRNILNDNDNDINYRNYNDIKYDYNFIEEELAKVILPGLKKFNKKIKYMIYLFEGFKGDNSSILVEYNFKYPKRELTKEEKNYIHNLAEINNNTKYYNDIFSSLQIIMKEIVNENYNQEHLIYNAIEKFPKYIKLNEELVNMFKRYIYQEEKKYFTLMTLVPIYEYFEKICWEEIKKYVLKDYQIELNEKIKEHILAYFDEDANKIEIVISKRDLASAIRKLISRYLASFRGIEDINPKKKLRLQISREDLWDKNIIEHELFETEINKIFIDEIIVGNSMALYNLIGEEDNNNNEIIKNNNNQKNDIKLKEINNFEININNINNINDNKIEEHRDNEALYENDENEEEEEEEEEEEGLERDLY